MIVLESNLFPNISVWYSISFKVIGTGLLQVGLVTWDATYENPVFTPATLFAASPEPITVLDLGSSAYTVEDGYQALKYLISAPAGVEHQLRIESYSDNELFITDVLVDPHEAQFEFFNGDSIDGAPDDYRWHGGLENKQFSIWYNNYLNTEARLFGHYDADTYVPGMLEDWVPTGASVVPHWEAVTVDNRPPAWSGNAFYPLKDLYGTSVTDLNPEYGPALIVFDGLTNVGPLTYPDEGKAPWTSTGPGLEIVHTLTDIGLAFTGSIPALSVISPPLPIIPQEAEIHIKASAIAVGLREYDDGGVFIAMGNVWVGYSVGLWQVWDGFVFTGAIAPAAVGDLISMKWDGVNLTVYCNGDPFYQAPVPVGPGVTDGGFLGLTTTTDPIPQWNDFTLSTFYGDAAPSYEYVLLTEESTLPTSSYITTEGGDHIGDPG